MNPQEVLNILAKCGAVITDSHIVYTSGKHGSAYVNKDAVYPHTHDIANLCLEIARHYAQYSPQVVVAPAIGGVVLTQWTASGLTNLLRSEVLAVYAEKAEDGESFVIKRGYDKLIPGKRVLIVEDVLTTGGSVKKVIEVVKSLGGQIVGAGVLCNRGGIKPEDIGVTEIYSIVNVTLDAWDEAECPLCAKGVAINTDVGKGREYLARKAAE